MILVPFVLALVEALSARVDRAAERELHRRAAAATAKSAARLLTHAAIRRRMAWRVAIADMAGELGFVTFWAARQVAEPAPVAYAGAGIVCVAIVFSVLFRAAARQLSLEQIDSLIARYEPDHWDVSRRPRTQWRLGPADLARLAWRQWQVALMQRAARRRRARRVGRRVSVQLRAPDGAE
jgi:hypothetical protein